MELNNIIITDITNWEVIGNWLEKEAKIERSLNFYSNAYRCYGEETAILIYDDALQYSPKSFYKSDYPFCSFTFYTQKEFEDTFINKKEKIKPIEDWLKELPEPYRSKALYTRIEYPLSDRLTKSLAEALVFGFNWKSTDEGHDYWDKVDNTILRGDNLISDIEPEESEKYDESIYDKWKSLLE